MGSGTGSSDRGGSAPAKGSTPPDALTEAALAYAARGWPVFPCNPKNKQPLLARLKDGEGKPIPNSGGVSRASTDPEQIKAWWARWPKALVGLATGHPTLDAGGLRLFVVDFDPREDPDTGEIWTLDRLKAALEAQMECEFPVTLAVLTPSDGVHAYLLQPDADGDGGGAPVTNRGNLPEHVDVRGLGGYVIAPPSQMGPNAIKGQAGLRYRIHRKAPIGGIAKAPARLIEILRERRGGGEAASRPSAPARSLPADLGEAEREAIGKYALTALDGECKAVRSAPSGSRNAQLNESALKIASLVAAGALDATIARYSLEAAARDNPGRDDDRQLIATIDSGWSAGMNNPRDLSEIAAAARERASRGGRRPSRSAASSRPCPSDNDDNDTPSSQTGSSGSGDDEKGHGGDAGADLTRKCAFRAQTDLGNLERFLSRHGGNFLYVEAWGWLAWDGRRWNRDMAMALLGYAVQRTMRAIQEEADLIRESGVPEPDPGADRDLFWMTQKRIAAETKHDGKRLDRVLERKRDGKVILLSDTIAKWGRTSEGASHINCIAKLAEARLSANPQDFDADPLLLNAATGTIAFLRPDRGFTASHREREHRREDRITKIAGCGYDSKAKCPLFDAFLAKVQPEPDMRDFLGIWAGYNSLGLADAQKMCVFYGEGSNGKGVWITTLATILGDYAWKAAIETYIDQGRYRKGSDASPDLAALQGRRMVYANEPEDNSKFSDGLIKAMTSDEPLGGVRELNKAPFELMVTFTNTVLANNRPKIGTDHGIQRRMQIVPWDVIIPDEEADLRLKDKLKAEASGVFNRVIAGAVAYLDAGLPIPEAVKTATREYHEENDLLGQFLDLVIARVPGQKMAASELHSLFAAWQTWAQLLPATGKAWSAKYLNAQMKKKRFRILKSSTMQWQDIAARYGEADFTDHEGKAVTRALRAPDRFDGEIGVDDAGKEKPPPSAPPDDAEFLPDLSP